MNITKRELEVIKKLSEGLNTKEVACDLFLSPYSIEVHKRNIFNKMNTCTLVQFGAMAVRYGIIACLALILSFNPCKGQSQFEIEGTIKATGLAGPGDRMVMAGPDGNIKISQQNPAIFEIKDSTGDVRFRFNADKGLYQILMQGDTLLENQFINLVELAPLGANSIKRQTKALSEDGMRSFVMDRVMPKIIAANMKVNGKLKPMPELSENEIPQRGNINKREFGGSFNFTHNGSTYYGSIHENGRIASVSIDVGPERFSFDFNTEGELVEAHKSLGVAGHHSEKTLRYDSQCRLVEIIHNGDTTKVEIHNPDNNSFTSMDGINTGAFSNANPNLINAWNGVDANGDPAMGVGDANNQVAALPDQLFVFNQDGNIGQQVMFDKDGIGAYKDNDLSDPNDTPQFLNFFWDFANNRILVCGDVHIKGNVTATGSISDNSMNQSTITKSLKKYLSDQTISGNVVTDSDGKARIPLDHKIESNYKNFRYQLTTIGSFSKAIIGKEIHNGSFEIWTEQSDTKVSWQVSASAKSMENEVADTPPLENTKVIQRIYPQGKQELVEKE